MTTIDTFGRGAHGGGGHEEESYLTSKGSVWATIWPWATTIDHKKIGIMYLVATLFMFFLGGLAALALRLELFYPVRQKIVNGVPVVTGQFFAQAGAGYGDNNAI